LCKRIGILAGGKLLREGPLEELCRTDASWKARFAAGADEAAIVLAGFRPAGDGSSFLIDAADAPALNSALDRARRGGALLVELTRASRDLEAVLTETLGNSA
jgi:ABC-2 type transport system ATP-binding protein